MLLHKKIGLLVVALLLSACSTPTKSLYQWDQYQKTLYQHYQPGESSPGEQIAVLQKMVEKARAKGSAVPPGLHAHLGLLYANVGQNEEAFRQFDIEKTLFPEAAPFMDFLLRQHKQPRSVQ
jgi:hypothetical protein